MRIYSHVTASANSLHFGQALPRQRLGRFPRSQVRWKGLVNAIPDDPRTLRYVSCTTRNWVRHSDEDA